MIFILVWLVVQTIEEPFDGVLSSNMPIMPKFVDLRGRYLPTVHAYTRYNDENLYNVISDTGAYIYENNYDPRKYNTCKQTKCPNSRDTRFLGDICLSCRK